VVSKIGTELASKDVDRWILFRRSIYVGFIVVTLMLFGIAAWHHSVSEKKETWVSTNWDSALLWVADLVPFGETLYEYLLRPFLIYWELAVIAVALLAIFYASSKFAQSKLRRAFAEFWRKKLPEPWW
jgi:hypothetical protein